MIITWMASTVAFGVVIGVITWLAQTIAPRQWPRRWLWLAAIVTSLGAAVISGWPDGQPALTTSTYTYAPGPATESTVAEAPAPIVGDAALLGGWAALSLLAFFVLIAGQWQLARLVRRGHRRLVAGRDLVISREFGPAAIGFFRVQVVMPEWLLSLSPAEQQLILRHEDEHVAAHDQWALLIGLAALVLMPWNIALWWGFSRLRVAIEIDCDARVAPDSALRPKYGQLLLQASNYRRQTRPVLAFAEGRSALAERLVALLEQRTLPRAQRWVRGASAMACAAAMTWIPRTDLRPLLLPAPIQLREMARAAKPMKGAMSTLTAVPDPSPSRPLIRARPSARHVPADAPLEPQLLVLESDTATHRTLRGPEELRAGVVMRAGGAGGGAFGFAAGVGRRSEGTAAGRLTPIAVYTPDSTRNSVLRRFSIPGGTDTIAVAHPTIDRP